MSIRATVPAAVMAAALLVLAGIFVSVLSCSRDDEPLRPVTEQEEALRRLEALPYLSAAEIDPEDREKSGVTIHDPSRAFQGLNLYHDYKNAYLLDMTGETRHTWVVGAEGPLHHVELAENGDLLAVVKDRALLRLNRDSTLLWSRAGRFHHDVAEDDEGNLYALARRAAWIDFEGTRLPLLDDRLVVLTGDGDLIEEISIGSLAADRIQRERLEEAQRMYAAEDPEDQRPERDSVYDMLHTNSVEILPADISGVGARGDLLLCFRELDLVAVVDREARKLVWSWGRGELDRPHHGVPLEGGRVLAYDNGSRRGFTRILVLDPSTGAIEWEHRGTPPSSLFSSVMGSAQPLPNGNFLVTDSVRGRVLEVTPDHDIVWEWFNRVTIPSDGFGDQAQRLTIYRMQRLAPTRWPSAGEPVR